MEELKKSQFYVAADCVVFTIHKHELKLLLIKRKNEPFKARYALPGGFVDIDENLDAAAKRELLEETGVKDILLKQLNAFGDVGRDPRGRVVSVPFIALIDGEDLKLSASTDAELAKWHDAYDLPELAFDHKKIIDMALSYLRHELLTTNIAFQLMPNKFTLSELQKAYEVILGKALDKRNFRKKILELSMVKELNESKMEGAHRPAKLFSFKDPRYKAF